MFYCNICNMSFTRKYSKNRHMKNIHNNDIYKNQASVIGKRKRDINGENELNQKVKKIKSDNFSGKRKRENDAQTKNEKRFKKWK